MPGIGVHITSPAANAVVGRKQLITCQVSAFNGSIGWAQLQFGVGGPIVDIRNPHGGFSFGFDGLIPNNIRPGQAFQVFFRAGGQMQTRGEPEPEYEQVDGETSRTFILENVVPVVTLDPFQAAIGVLQAPLVKTIGGNVSEGNGPPYTTPAVHYRLGNGPFTAAAVTGNRWSATVSLQPGDYPLTVQASDQFASVTTVGSPLSVYLYIPPAAGANQPRTPLSIPTTASITSWTRLEPRASDTDVSASSRARLFDPLWLMTRQWQMGEFQAEDTGSPVHARMRGSTASLTRCHFGELTADNTSSQPYDPARAPLETLVERRRMRDDRGNGSMLMFAVDAGQHFLRMLDLNTAARKYRPAFQSTYPLQRPAATDPLPDEATRRFIDMMAQRVVDARTLARAFRPAGATTIVLDSALKIAAAEEAAVRQVAAAWLTWYDTLFAELPAPADDAWIAPRIEYQLSVATRLSAQSQDAMTFTATEFDGGRLDWSSFDVNTAVTLDTAADRTFAPFAATVVPAPVTFRGMPAPRFWEFEDAQVAYGLLSAGPTDLAHLLMIEYASSYGNDWYVVPLTTPVGTVTQIDSLVVTDTFGVRNLLRPIGTPGLDPANFSMWQSSRMRTPSDSVGAPVANRFFLPPTLGRSIDGPPLEDVLFMRDEMANMAWAIERSIESPIEQALSRRSDAAASDVTPAPATSGDPVYRLASSVPGNWIPLLPIQRDNGGTLVQLLKRGVVMQIGAPNLRPTAQGQVLNAGSELLLYDEEVPREGVRVASNRRMTRWTDGSTWVWTALRAEVGRGEGSSGLRFDQVQTPGDNP